MYRNDVGRSFFLKGGKWASRTQPQSGLRVYECMDEASQGLVALFARVHDGPMVVESISRRKMALAFAGQNFPTRDIDHCPAGQAKTSACG